MRGEVLILGLNAWLVIGLWPQAFVPAHSVQSVGLAALALVALFGGCALMGTTLRPGGVSPSALSLLVVYPAALNLSLIMRDEAVNQRAFGPLAMSLAVLSLLGYGVSVTTDETSPRPLRETRSRPLDEEPARASDRRQRLRVATIALTVAGAMALAVVAPTVGGHEELLRGWPSAPLQGGVLTAVVAGALGASLVAAFLGPGLRAEPAVRARPAHHFWMFLALSALGAITYYSLTGSQ